MAKGQKSRKTKVSAGLNRGAKPVALTEMQKALMGKGILHTSRVKRTAKKK